MSKERNALKSYVRRTMLKSATEYAYPKTRRTAESTRSAFIDAMRGTDTGWWHDLIYTAPMLEMAHRYRQDIAAALTEYRDATGESFVYRPGYGEPEIVGEEILSALMRRRPWNMADMQERSEPGAALTGLRFAVEWYAGELAREYCPDL